MKRNTFILKCFLQFADTNLDGSQKGGKLFKFASERWGYPERGGYLRKGEVPTLQETMQSYCTPNHAIANAYSLKHPSA